MSAPYPLNSHPMPPHASLQLFTERGGTGFHRFGASCESAVFHTNLGPEGPVHDTDKPSTGRTALQEVLKVSLSICLFTPVAASVPDVNR
jgi:hypothetical protein